MSQDNEYSAGVTPTLGVLFVVSVAVGIFLEMQGLSANHTWPGTHRGDPLLGLGAIILVFAVGMLKGAFGRSVQITRHHFTVKNGSQENRIAWEELNYMPTRGLFPRCAVSGPRVRPQAIESVFFRDYARIVEALDAHAKKVRDTQMPI